MFLKCYTLHKLKYKDFQSDVCMDHIAKVSIEVLKVHPRNQEFFDDISGADYEQFKTSIKEDGIISEIVVAADMTILSGHQRYKAAKELGFKQVPIRIREDVETEDDKLKILLASNFGRTKNDEAKKRKVAAEYVALCGYKHGDNQWTGHDGISKLTLAQIAEQLGTSERSLKRSLRIENNLTEEMKQLLDDGVISTVIASDVLAGMSEDEQIDFISKLDVTQKYINKEAKKIADAVKADHRGEKELQAQLDQAKIDVTRAENDAANAREKMLKSQKRVEELEKQIGGNTTVKSAQRDIEYFTSATNNYIKSYGGRVWAFSEIQNIPDQTRIDFINSIKALDGFAQQLLMNIEGNIR